MYTPYFSRFSLISNIYINIHEYADLIICISEHWMKVLSEHSVGTKFKSF